MISCIFARLGPVFGLMLVSLPALAQNPIIHIHTPLGVIDLELLEDAAPQTVANFLTYVDDGDFVDSFVHRSAPGFVIQGGGYTYTDATGVGEVPTDAPIANEFNLSNVRGTVAMAKLPSNPDSATSQWFINLADNTDLDTQNGGFTVFARVVGNGMSVADAIAALPRVNASGAFDSLPVIDYTGGYVTAANLVFAEPARRRFADVPEGYWAYSFIDQLAASGITGGCGGASYCPDGVVTRAQMAVFLERGMKGGAYSPPAASGTAFLDVGAGDFAAAFIEQFFLDGITSGCGGNNYCPNAPVTRAQMAVFLLKAVHGAGYSPPSPTGVFGDVNVSYWAAPWIEQLAAEGITSGCGNGNFCPDSTVTRAQMAVFLVRAFGL